MSPISLLVTTNRHRPGRRPRSGRWGIALTALLLLLAFRPEAFAQPTTEGDDSTLTTTFYATDTVAEPEGPWLYIGAYGGLTSITYEANLPPTVFNSTLTLPITATFTGGDGNGVLMGVLAELPLGESFNVGARLGYQLHSGQLQQRYSNTADVTREASVMGTVETKFGQVSITPYMRLAPFTFPLYVYAGPTILLPAQASYTYTERIDGPPGALFRSNNRITRTIASRDFDKATTAFAVSGGVGYEYSFSDAMRAFAEVQVQPMLNDLLSPLRATENWKATQTAFLVGIRYAFISGPDAPAPPPVVAGNADTTKPRVTDSSEAKGVTAGGLSDTITLSKKTVKATEVQALLPYIFFEEDSAGIPARYVRLDTKTRARFQIERLERGNTLGNYYQLLNVIGLRMRDARRGDITLTGCISQFEQDSTLALRRAEAVRDYLTTVWRIAPRRIKVVARGLPANPSISEVDERQGARENQRVEISSENYVFERPIELVDSAFLQPVGTVRFLPPPSEPDTTGLVDSWSLDVMIGDSVIKRAVSGIGNPPKQIDYQIENRPDLDLRGPVTVSSTLTIRDTALMDLARIPSRSVVVRPEGEYQEERNVVGGKYVDTYNLLLYSFDSSQAASFSIQSAEMIKRKIAPNSVVRVIGHTDRIGLPYYNQALSKRRAEFAAQILNVQPQEIIGRGERELVYDNEFPEGRYYSRTVTVIIETPISGPSNDTGTTPSTPRGNGTDGGQ